MNETRKLYQIYTNTAKRLFLWYVCPNWLDLILVSEFPKSGGSWLCQMLSDVTGLNNPRDDSPQIRRSILHGHQLFYSRKRKFIAVVRDGRDVMISAYFYFLFKNDRNHPSVVKYHRNQVGFENYDNVTENLPKFIDYMFTKYSKKNILRFSWSEFVQNITKNRDHICMIKYEDMLNDPETCLKKSLQYYELPIPSNAKLQKSIEKYSFKNLAGREPGVEDKNSFLRKGIAGDWRNYFNESASKIFKRHAGMELIELGYEKDLNW